MKAKDTVMSDEQIVCYWDYSVDQPKHLFLSAGRAIAEAQAEISFQEGIREVVDFVVDRIFPLLNMADVSVLFKDVWNAKTEEWGIG